MSETTVATENTTAVETQPVTSNEPTYGNPQSDNARRALYEKHYGSADEGTDQQTSVTDPASTAQVDQTSATRETTEQTTESAPASSEASALIEVLNAMKVEIAELKRQQVAPAATTGTSTTAAPEAPWVTALRNGDIVGAEEAMAAAVSKRVREELTQPLVQEAENRTVERMQAMNEVESFVKDLRTNNNDLLDMEGMITLDAQSRLAKVQASGVIKTTGDAVREYKKAVLEATSEARKVAQKLRGSGKNEAMVRTREVLSASTLPPQQVAQRTGESQQESQAEPESVQSYFEKRKSAETARRGLA